MVEFDLTSTECVVGTEGKSATLSVTNRQSSTESIDYTLTGPGTAVLDGAALLPGCHPRHSPLPSPISGHG